MATRDAGLGDITVSINLSAGQLRDSSMIADLKREGVTTLITSHLLDQVQRLCDRVALFQRGRILMMGTVPELAREVLGAGFVVDVEATAAPTQDLVPRLGAIPGNEIGMTAIGKGSAVLCFLPAADEIVKAGGAFGRQFIAAHDVRLG